MNEERKEGRKEGRVSGIAADLDGGDSGGVQLGAVLDGLGPEEGYELVKGQLHVMPLPSLGVKAPANRPHILH